MSLTFSFASMSVYKKMCGYICPGSDEELRMDINVLKSVGTWDGDLIQKIWAQFQNQSGIREHGWQSGSSLSFYWFNKNWMPLITWPMLLLSVSASRVTSPCRVSTLRTYDSYDLRATTHCTGKGRVRQDPRLHWHPDNPEVEASLQRLGLKFNFTEIVKC